MHQRIRVAGLVRRGDEFLLVRQTDRFGNVRWSLPGGRLEAEDENMFRGAEREVWEETGLEVSAGRLRFISEYHASDLFALTLIIECSLVDEQNYAEIHLENTVEGDDILEVAWKTIDFIRSAESGIGRTLSNPVFWESLENTAEVVHLGRYREAV